MNDEDDLLHRWLFAAAVALAAIAGTSLVVYISHCGIGISPDSVQYVEQARNLAGGRGFTEMAADDSVHPVTWFPPLFPTLLAAGGKHLGPLAVARVLNCGLMGINIVLAGILTALGARSRLAGALVAWIAVLAMPLLAVHSYAWSEPLFIALSLGGLGAIAIYRVRGRVGWLILAGILVAGTVLTRYFGGLLVVVGAALLLLGSAPLRRRLLDAALFALATPLPLALWLIRSREAGQAATGRQATVHLVTREKLHDLGKTLVEWVFATDEMRQKTGAIAIGAALVGLAFYLLATRRKTHDPARTPADVSDSLVLTLGLYAICYLPALFAAISLFDASTPLNERLLAPLFLPVLILVAAMLSAVVFRVDPKVRRFAVGAAVALAAVFFLAECARILEPQKVHDFSWAYKAHSFGRGYAGRGWRQSKAIAWVKELDPATPIYSNGYDAIAVCANRDCRRLPVRYFYDSGQPNPHYDTEMARLRAELRAHGGYVVYFSGIDRPYLPDQAEQVRTLGLKAVFIDKTEKAGRRIEVVYAADDAPSN